MNFEFDELASIHTKPGTLYHSVGHIIRSKIQSGEWQVEQKIPSERELMQVFNVSRATVRQGIDNLVMEGILYRMQGKGTFVAPPKLKQGVLRILDFSDLAKQNGLKITSDLLVKKIIQPPPHVLKHLGIQAEEQVIWIQRLINVNHIPILRESSYLSIKRFPDLVETYDGHLEPREFINVHYGVKISRVQETFEPVILEDEEAQLLGTQGGFPALWIEINAYEGQGNPVAYITALMRGDRCRTYIDLVLEKGP